VAANTRAVMRALKAVAPAPSTGGFGNAPAPYLGPGPSPLVASYNDWGPYAGGRSQGTNASLPRDWSTFLSGMFGPLAPIEPVPIDIPPPGEQRPEPRRYPYSVGWNMPMGMPGTEGIGKYADFGTLRTLCDLYSVARSAITLRKNELRGVGWDIAPTRQAAKAMRGDHKAMVDFAARRAKLVKFFRRPDPNYADFTSWFNAILEEFFVTDAISLYVHPSRVKGKGLLGTSVAALDLIDGSTVKPLVDVRGGRPAPPNPAFQAFEYGVPRVDLMTLIREAEESIGDDQEELVAEYRGDQLMYLPFTQRVWSPYGFAPIEGALIPVMMGLNKQNWQLDFYKEGSVPAIYVSPGDTAMTASQLRELQDALNGIAGDVAWKHKIIVLPGGSKVDPQKSTTLADDFDLLVQTQTTMGFDVMPFELGIQAQVSVAAASSSGAARQLATAKMDLWQRKSTIPTLLFFKSTIFDTIIQDVCGQLDMEWVFEGLSDEQNISEITPALVEQVGAGLASIDEARLELGREPWGLPITSDPGWATQWGGLVPLTGVTEATAQPLGGSPGPGGPGRGSGMSSTLTVPMGDPGAGSPSPAPTVPRNRMSTGQRREQARQVTTTQNRTGSTGTPAHSGARGSTGPVAAARAAVDGQRAAQRTRKATTTREVIEAALLGDEPPAIEPTAVLAAKDVPDADLGLSAKAARELGLLRSHLRRGEPVTAWQPRFIPPRLLSQVAEHMAKGMSADEACAAARPLLRETRVGKAAEGHVTCGRGHKHWGRYGAAGLLIRAKGADGRWRYLLHKRGENSDHPGTWGIPGGALHEGEMPEMGAIREATEELGVLPTLRPTHTVTDDHDGWVYYSVAVDSPAMFQPSVDGSTAHETGGWAWMTAAEIGSHPGMHPGFAESFTAVRRARGSKTLTKGENMPVPIEDGQPVKAKVVRRMMAEKFPSHATAWVKDATWTSADVPFTDIDFDDETSWSAHHQQDKVKHFSHLVHTGQPIDPPVMVQIPNKAKLRIVDGHHRVLGARAAKHDVIRAYVGTVRAGDERWSVTHSSQARQGHDPMNKAGKVPKKTVNYRDADTLGRRCGTCSMYRPGGTPASGSCTLVEGLIRAAGVCDRWDPETPAAKATAGYSLNPRSGMISLDVPEGTIKPLPGGVDDHHVTVVYLGPDVDDDAYARACDRAAAAAGMVSGPLTGMLGPVGTFPPSDSSDGKVPVFLHAHLPGADVLREALEDLSASEYSDWKPHVTLAYADEGDPLPEWTAPAPVTFTHLSVHRGHGEVRRFPLGPAVGKSERTPYVSTVHNPVGHESLWHTPDVHVGSVQQLPAYMQNTAHALMREGHGEQSAIAMAVASVKAWAAGHAFGGKVRVTPEVQAAAQRALREWERLKMSHTKT